MEFRRGAGPQKGAAESGKRWVYGACTCLWHGKGDRGKRACKAHFRERAYGQKRVSWTYSAVCGWMDGEGCTDLGCMLGACMYGAADAREKADDGWGHAKHGSSTVRVAAGKWAASVQACRADECKRTSMQGTSTLSLGARAWAETGRQVCRGRGRGRGRVVGIAMCLGSKGPGAKPKSDEPADNSHRHTGTHNDRRC